MTREKCPYCDDRFICTIDNLVMHTCGALECRAMHETIEELIAEGKIARATVLDDGELVPGVRFQGNYQLVMKRFTKKILERLRPH